MIASEFFKKNKWVKINNFIDINMANLLYYHVILEKKRLDYIYKVTDNDYDKEIYGTLEDPQAVGDFSKYGEPIFDTLLDMSVNQMQEFTGKKLIPTYTYHRLYTTNTILERHKDRESCEISTTLFLGHDISNLDNKNYTWPMYVKDEDGTEHKVDMNVGDMLVYSGCDLEHWREPFEGVNHAQVFMHYNEEDGQYNIKYDGRPVLGLEGKWKNHKKDIDSNYVKIIE